MERPSRRLLPPRLANTHRCQIRAEAVQDMPQASGAGDEDTAVRRARIRPKWASGCSVAAKP
jgi:hypothetical protein